MCQLKLAIDTFSASTLNYYVNVDFNWTKNQNKKKIKHHQAFFKSHCNSCISLSKVFFYCCWTFQRCHESHSRTFLKWRSEWNNHIFFPCLKYFRRFPALLHLLWWCVSFSHLQRSVNFNQHYLCDIIRGFQSLIRWLLGWVTCM